MTIAILTREDFNAQYDALDKTDVPIAVAMPNKAKRREYSAPTKEIIASMKQTRDRLYELMIAGA